MKTHTEQPVRHDHCSVFVSSLLMDGVATVGFLALAVLAFVSWSRKRRFAEHLDAAFSPDAPLLPGKAHIMGTVEWEKGASMAVRALIEEEGSEQEISGVWTHEWAETSRRVYAQPFYIRHTSGHRIRVEPGKNVRIIDAMDRLGRVDLTTRLRVAELTPGETVFAVGELRRAPDPEAPLDGYRGQAVGYLLVPPPDREMLLSSEPLGPTLKPAADSLLRRTIIILIMFFLFHALFASFHARRWLGQAVDTHVTMLQEEKGVDGILHHWVMMQGTKDFTFVDDVRPSDFFRIRKDDAVQVRYVPQWESASVIGPGATVNERAYLALPLAFVMLLMALGVRSHHREWYDLNKLPPQRGSGPLEKSNPFVPEPESEASKDSTDDDELS